MFPGCPSTPWLERVAPVALAASAGFLVAASLPPWGFWPLAFVGVALLEISLGPAPSARRRFVHGGAFGLVWMSMGMGWMWFLTVPGYLAASLIFALFHAAAALAAPTGRWRLIGRPAAHTLVEALRLAWPFGGVPLATMGISQAGGPLLGVASVVGVIGLTWIVFQVGTAVVDPWPYVRAMARHDRPESSSSLHGVFALGAVVLLLALSVVAPTGSPTGEVLTVAAVQGGGEQGTSALDVPSALVTERHLETTAGIEPGPELDVVLWPENTISIRREPFEGSEVNELVADQAARLGVPVLVGITEDADMTGRAGPDRFTNAHVVVLPSGEVTDRYDKVRRVPFGEFLPLRGLFEMLAPGPTAQIGRDAVSGEDPAVLAVALGGGREVRAGVVISWEVFFAGRVREGVLEGGEIVFNPTNGASYTGTILQTQQVAVSRLRATESGRWVVQAAPTGFTVFVGPDGSVVDRTAISERAVVTNTVELRSGRTWYTRLGDGPITLAVALGFAVSVWRSGSATALLARSARLTRRAGPSPDRR
jgi:apolipoprotein N-acyltransferase